MIYGPIVKSHTQDSMNGHTTSKHGQTIPITVEDVRQS